ncbi:hypothetical protein [Bradyrhizobium diazoefficiens]|uniref:hypothetical protein n=1 Tax=Bradyrhizobium diazoefficiens TaxID=1355477 RepID=UPI00271544DA|nr:hypothetical protein [Bradyrhizobium diazoefficiens]WLB38011.1 hypothetical protein QIH78_42890 [Bradyrhizobium diazoefficiens]WLC17104.1 hypothetical protein QIH76_01395 [Bradyrhizobium diazoefficiens]
MPTWATDLEPELSGFGYCVSRDRGESAEQAEARVLENCGDARRAERRDYVSNGMLNAAALAMGFSAERTHAGSPNAYFNISSKENSSGNRAEAA